MEQPPRLSTYTFVAFYINEAFEKGLGKNITFDDFYLWAETGNILEKLSKAIPGFFDFSLFKPGSDQAVAFDEVIGRIANAQWRRERRKYGLETNGLCLLLAYILEAIQSKEWIDE